MFRFVALPAGDGDCFLLTWGEGPALHHMVVDGGRKGAWAHLRPRLQMIADVGEPLERLVVTHIDADHIEGMLALVRDGRLPVSPKQVWFNGFHQVVRMAALGERQGDAFSAELVRLGWPQNTDFADMIASGEGAPAAFEIEGLRITMLSPDRRKLAALGARWSEWRDGQSRRMVPLGRAPMPRSLDVDRLAVASPIDREPPNGSSIAFVAEYNGRRVLLAGDAHPDTLEAAIAPLAAAEGDRYRVDLFKVSHHGSRKNTTPRLIQLVDCRDFVFSSNGSQHGHPDPETVARILKFSPSGRKRLWFNYRSDRTAPWDAPELQERHDYDWLGPDGTPGFLEIDVPSNRR